jgi:hypothetical protein
MQACAARRRYRFCDKRVPLVLIVAATWTICIALLRPTAIKQSLDSILCAALIRASDA